MSTTDYANGGIPKTIDELKDYCERNGFTPSKTRFFVGFDYTGAKAFGIYKDDKTGEFVVYKNKADGSRAIRYRGTDEEFAVVELYDRLQSEIANQKLRYAADMAERERNKYEKSSSGMPESIRNFHIEDHPVRSRFDLGEDESYESSAPRSSGNGQDDGSGFLKVVISIIIWILVILFGLGGVGGGGGGSSYRSSSGYESNYDSGWSSDNWDSGYTDWYSDW